MYYTCTIYHALYIRLAAQQQVTALKEQVRQLENANEALERDNRYIYILLYYYYYTIIILLLYYMLILYTTIYHYIPLYMTIYENRSIPALAEAHEKCNIDLGQLRRRAKEVRTHYYYLTVYLSVF
jgi:hypothetical protein